MVYWSITMKSQVKRPKIDNLTFQWKNKSPGSSDIRKNPNTEYNKQHLLDEYFNLLSEIKPYKQELTDSKIFGIPFTI